MLQINNVKLPYNKEDKLVIDEIAKKLRISKEEIVEFKIVKMSIDARKKNNIVKVYTVNFNVKNWQQILKRSKDVSKVEKTNYCYPQKRNKKIMKSPPIIIGTGPSGIFAAYLLAEMGYRPILLERGEKIEDRTKTVNEFWEKGILNTESNVQFGEGGAGTYSDGKLTTRIKDDRITKVLQIFVENGAPTDILFKNKPHLGTDNLKKIMINMRNRITDWGGIIHFNSKVNDLIIENNQIKGVVINDSKKIYSEVVFLGIGNSARDTFEMLYKKGIKMEAKPFAVGFRIEHKQNDINIAQYGNEEVASYLGNADYKLTFKASNGRSVYSFCMCPGGKVIAAASEMKRLVVNGMSEHARNCVNANSAIIVNVTPDDFPGNHPLKGMYFQREIEAKAYQLGGGGYMAPVQKLESYLNHSEIGKVGEIIPSYKLGYKICDLNKIYPEFINIALHEALLSFGSKIRGFDRKDAILSGVETRSSSPIRIIRDVLSLESVSVSGFYPIGEGAGYSGGITSSAVDGLKAAEKLIEKH